MFAVHVSNPFTAKSRDAARDREVIEKHLEEREQRESTRRAAYLTEQRMQKNFKQLSTTDPQKRERNLAERAKYQFEADSEDEEMENEIDSNLDVLSGVTGRLNALARATGEEIDTQNKHLDRISGKVSSCVLDQCFFWHAILMICYRVTRSTWVLPRTEPDWTASGRRGRRGSIEASTKMNYQNWAEELQACMVLGVGE